MKIEKGKIIFTIGDYENIREEIIEGKKYYVLYTKRREHSFITKELFEEYFLTISKKKIDIYTHFKLNHPQLTMFLKKEYGTDSVKEILEILNKTKIITISPNSEN